MKTVDDPALMNIINVFQNNHKSIISDLFYGFRSQILTCNNCRESLINYQIFNFFIFPIEVVYNSKNKQDINTRSYGVGRSTYQTSSRVYGNFYNGYSSPNRYEYNYNRNQKKEVTLEDCFDNEISENIFDGDNQIYCNRCKKSCKARGENKIFSTPYFLILILNRGKGNEFKCDVDFKEELNIKKYVQSKDCPYIYNLIGVISHLGESSMNGHFIADCKHFDGQWYSFSDSSVSGPSYRYNKKGTPYILFYQYKEI